MSDNAEDQEFDGDVTSDDEKLPIVKTEDLLRLFEPDKKTPVFSEVQVRPQPGYSYILDFSENKKIKEDFRADQYHFFANGSTRNKIIDGAKVTRKYFKLKIGKDEFSFKFKRHVCYSDKYPNQALISYQGDNSVCVPLVHGNVNPEGDNSSKEHHRSAPSLIDALKVSKGKPDKVYDDILEKATKDPLRQWPDVPRDREQIHNSQKRERLTNRSSSCAVGDLWELSDETDFVKIFTLQPNLNVVCFLSGKFSKYI